MGAHLGSPFDYATLQAFRHTLPEDVRRLPARRRRGLRFWR